MERIEELEKRVAELEEKVNKLPQPQYVVELPENQNSTLNQAIWNNIYTQ